MEIQRNMEKWHVWIKTEVSNKYLEIFPIIFRKLHGSNEFSIIQTIWSSSLIICLFCGIMICLIFMNSWKGPCTSANIKTRIKSKILMSWSSRKKREGIYILFCPNKIHFQIRIYILLHIKKILILKLSKAFSLSLMTITFKTFISQSWSMKTNFKLTI